MFTTLLISISTNSGLLHTQHGRDVSVPRSYSHFLRATELSIRGRSSSILCNRAVNQGAELLLPHGTDHVHPTWTPVPGFVSPHFRSARFPGGVSGNTLGNILLPGVKVCEYD